MRPALSAHNLLSELTPGMVFRRWKVLPFSKAVDRDLKQLETEGVVQKLQGGLYYRPKTSRFGVLPPSEGAFIRAFLKDNRFLVVSPNDYNGLGLGLTQLHNFVWVYNRKRHTTLQNGGVEYRFRRPVDFPISVAREFLLVDLLNNLPEVGEDETVLKDRIRRQAKHFNQKKVWQNALLYGKVSTRRFLEIVFSRD